MVSTWRIYLNPRIRIVSFVYEKEILRVVVTSAVDAKDDKSTLDISWLVFIPVRNGNHQELVEITLPNGNV